MKTLVSVILPAYNSSKTIEKAILSIKKQIFDDWELIIINDGSTDDTQQIAEIYAHQDSRIKIINQRNAGRSSARNIGLKIAKGEYISFLDSDDIYFEHTLDNLVTSILKYNSDLVIGNISYNKKTKNILNDKYLERENAVKEIFSLRVTQPTIFNSVCNKLFKKEIIQKKNIFFPSNIEMGEDVIFVLRYCNQIQSIVTISVSIYNYIPSIQSITKSRFRSSYMDRKHLSSYLLIDLYKKWNLPLDKVYGSFFNYKMFGCSFAASTNFALLKKTIDETFIDSHILYFADKIKYTKYDNLYAQLIRHRQKILWMLIAIFLGILKRIKNKLID